MLEPREADIPALFLFLVVLPLVTYFLLGKWNESSKKIARVSLLAQLAAEEARTVEAMAPVDVLPVVPALNTGGLHVCARCFCPATTRCSRCKSVRYCSGKCQIIHWRQAHKQECQQWQNDNSKISATFTMAESSYEKAAMDVKLANHKSAYLQNDERESKHNFCTSETPIDCTVDPRHISDVKRSTPVKMNTHKFKQEISRLECEAGSCQEEAKSVSPNSSCAAAPNGDPRKHKSGNDCCLSSDSGPNKWSSNCQTPANNYTDSRKNLHGSNSLNCENRSAFGSSTSGIALSKHSERNANASEIESEFALENIHHGSHDFSLSGEKLVVNSSIDKVSAKGEVKFLKPPYTVESNSASQKSATKPARENLVNGTERKTCTEKELFIPGQDSTGISNIGDRKRMASPKRLSKLPKHNIGGNFSDTTKKTKAIFPFEDLVKFFQCEVRDISPRGLLNCGNSCYANAVLQCLTYTKPLLVYLLRGMHSRSCCMKDWCLMCELELHVAALRGGGAPLSPGKILSNLRNIGCRIGGGSQEDAHEFLRLLVTSMQSICLEGLGGEREVDPRLQETTLIQQIFGGRLRSKVKCLQCELESERYENIMDLTLEIHGWVECLEDALTQFTAPEDLDGDNMYRCGRCSTYVRAQKQLSVHEAPNILTIVLKRFQTGKYGKINKCVTFPDMLDMIPFMTGTSDSPPLYMLYAVVVHLDTFNASFSGHYVSYVKDLQGTWFRIDDTEVQAVHVTQVMSEGAYMLFYSRSFPRPPRIYSSKAPIADKPCSTKHSVCKPPKSSRNGQSEPSFAHDKLSGDGSNLRTEASSCIDVREAGCFTRTSARNILPRKGSFLGSGGMSFSDAASSDWSLFTSSDESSFTTESTSDSFSTADYSDAANLDPISSLFSPLYIPGYSHKSTVSCTKLSHCRPQTRYFSECNGFILDSLTPELGDLHKGKNVGPLASGNNRCSHASHQSKPRVSRT